MNRERYATGTPWEPGYYLCPQCHYGLCDDYVPSETEELLGQGAD